MARVQTKAVPVCVNMIAGLISVVTGCLMTPWKASEVAICSASQYIAYIVS